MISGGYVQQFSPDFSRELTGINRKLNYDELSLISLIVQFNSDLKCDYWGTKLGRQ